MTPTYALHMSLYELFVLAYTSHDGDVLRFVAPPGDEIEVLTDLLPSICLYTGKINRVFNLAVKRRDTASLKILLTEYSSYLTRAIYHDATILTSPDFDQEMRRMFVSKLVEISTGGWRYHESDFETPEVAPCLRLPRSPDSPPFIDVPYFLNYSNNFEFMFAKITYAGDESTMKVLLETVYSHKRWISVRRDPTCFFSEILDHPNKWIFGTYLENIDRWAPESRRERCMIFLYAMMPRCLDWEKILERIPDTDRRVDSVMQSLSTHRDIRMLHVAKYLRREPIDSLILTGKNHEMLVILACLDVKIKVLHMHDRHESYGDENYEGSYKRMTDILKMRSVRHYHSSIDFSFIENVEPLCPPAFREHIQNWKAFRDS